ncbi:MAG: cache domain-containing protein [Myxococcales bacterium]|nr:cache domain-containing protein [Myxococcales bacterium]
MVRLARTVALVASLVALAAGGAGCKDKGKLSADGARASLDTLTALTVKDVEEVERGLPEGSKRIASAFAKDGDPKNDLAQVRRSLLKIRREVPDLLVAKSTFFALVDDKGIAIRNDLEQDAMAGKDVVGAYPALKKALEGESFVTTTGVFPSANPPPQPDKEWVAAVPVKRDDGKLLGMLVTGWTYRRFAYHLQESMRRDISEALMKGGDKGKLPVLYTFVFDASGVYGARGTPDVNEKAMRELDVLGKTASGPQGGVITITDRQYGWAAARTPKLGPDIGIAVLRSEI